MMSGVIVRDYMTYYFALDNVWGCLKIYFFYFKQQACDVQVHSWNIKERIQL